MKKYLQMTLLLLVLLACCLPAAAMAAEDTVKTNFSIFSGAGETVQPDYPDFSYLIGEGLTKDDFDISYRSKQGSMTVDPVTGQITIASDLRVVHYMNVQVTYTPKVPGVGKETVFTCDVMAGRKLTKIYVDKTDVVMAMDQVHQENVEVNTSYIAGRLKATGYDPTIVEVTLRERSNDERDQLMTVKPLAVGETTITLLGYNGVTADVRIKVCEPPMQLKLAAEVFDCYAGETLDLGIDLGSGERHATYTTVKVNYYTNYQAFDYFPKGVPGGFEADEAGDYNIVLETHNGYSAAAVIHVYNRESAVSIKASQDVIRQGDEKVYIRGFDAKGKYVRPRRMEITKGGDIAALEIDRLITTGTGEVEVTVYNLDGTTCSEVFEILPHPTRIILNQTEVTLEIGETFEVEVSFDQGELPYEWFLLEHSDPLFGVYPSNKQGAVVTAQAPGKSVYIVRAGELSQTLTIIVPESDKALVMECPPQPFGVGYSYQMAVKDRTGKVYPATFSLPEYETAATITPDGYFTALRDTTVTVRAQVPDGRYLYTSVTIRKLPLWLQHEAVVVRKSDTAVLRVKSDVGDVSWQDVEVKVADESVVGFQDTIFFPKKVGKTTVTVKSIYTGVSTTFTLEVISDKSEVYVGMTSFRLPYGYSAQMPKVTNSNGTEIVYRWKITHDNPGEGNPEASGFKLEGDTITCTWPTASCEITGTKWDGSQKVKVTVFGYLMPQLIYIEPMEIKVNVGETTYANLNWADPGCLVEDVLWVVEDPSILTCSQHTVGKNRNTLTGRAPGKTLLMAMIAEDIYTVCEVTVIDPNARVPGDANADGAVNLTDAMQILQGGEVHEKNANVNGDDKVDIQDALLLLQYSAGWGVALQ